MRLNSPAPWLLALALAAPALGDEPRSAPLPLDRRGDSIVACGERIAIGTPVILWSDPGGFDASKLPAKDADGKAARPGYGFRERGVDPALVAEARKNGWTLPTLQQAVDQFVIHYDVCGTSSKCFEVLQQRNLAVQFMLDLDGTIYQTCDLTEGAYHATKANGRSIGIEVANMGAYPAAELAKSPLGKWYGKDESGKTVITLPRGATVPTLAAGAPPLRPGRDQPVVGTVQGQELTQYDFTPQQYAALAKLTAGLCRTFPKIKRDLPRDEKGQVLDHVLPDETYAKHQGILGHYHVQLNKTDPGPAFRWDLILGKEDAPAASK
jgi:N-acetylmuramoyl-L-alanine amidase